MAEGKTSFVLKTKIKHVVKLLSDEQAGILLKTILAYVNDENPEVTDPYIRLAFEPIKYDLKEDLKKWEATCERNRSNGNKGGRPKNPKKPKKPTGLNENPKNPNEPDNDYDSEYVLLNSNKEKFDADNYKVQLSTKEYQSWRESWYMKFRVKPNSLSQIVDKFNIHLGLKDISELPKNLKDYKEHFYNWCNVQDRIGNLDEYKKGKKQGAL